MSQKSWLIAEPIDEKILASFPEISPVILQILWNRGLHTQEEMDLFLRPDWSRDVHSPWLFLQMRSAVDRIFQALESREMITIHGDYDADGVCGSTALISTLRDICRKAGFDEKKLSVFLPHREKDGYGLSEATVEHLHEHEKTRLLITVDCGISNRDAIARASELGIDVIVCDHHQIPELLPEKAILLHPLVPGEVYPNKKLCGTGVAFKLCCGLIERQREIDQKSFPEGYEKWLLDLVAIATVTDVMPLIGENRLLESFGLIVLNKTKRVGLKSLLQAAQISERELDTWSIGFQIGPRINAAGRMNHANAALNLLLCEDEAEAQKLALELNASNIERQKMSDLVYQEACKQIGEKGDRKIIFAVGENWPVGLIGLVAGKIMNEYNLPTFVISKTEQGIYTGSGRSLFGFDITAAMKKASSNLIRFGGHPQACGMSCENLEDVNVFIKVLENEALEYFADHDATPVLHLEAELLPSSVDWVLVESLEMIAPHGEANPKPIFAAKELEIVDLGVVGSDGAHLRFSARDKTGIVKKFIGFRFGEYSQRLKVGAKIDVAFEIGTNEWNGNKEIQFRVVDLKKYD